MEDAIHIINADGTGLHPLSDGTHTDFNQTLTRDGTNTPIWNRKNPKTGGYVVMASKGAKPGEEFLLTRKGTSYLGLHVPDGWPDFGTSQSSWSSDGLLPDDPRRKGHASVRTY